MRILCCAAAVSVLAASPAALANGLYENGSWQFQTTTDRANKAVVLDMIETMKAGGYTNYVNNNNTTNFYVDGHYIDCNMTSQALGNQGSVAQDAPVGSPTIGVDSSTLSSATGNSGTGTIAEGGDSSDTGATALKDDAGPVNNTSTTAGSNTVDTNQSNDGGTQTSSVTGSPFSSTVSNVSGAGGEASVALNSSQTMDNTTVSSAISNSTVCNFNTSSGSIGYPVNSTEGK